MSNADLAPAVQRDLAVRPDVTISRTESLIPRLQGANREEIMDYVRSGAKEDLPRAYDGPFPNGDLHLRTRMLTMLLGGNAEAADRMEHDIEARYRLGSFYIWLKEGSEDKQNVLGAIAQRTGGTLTNGENRHILSPSDPIVDLLGSVAENLHGDQAAWIVEGREGKEHTGRLFDDVTDVAYHDVSIAENPTHRIYFTDIGAPPAHALLRPQLGVWILKRRGGRYDTDTIGGGASAHTKTISRLGNFAGRTAQAALVLHDILDGTLPIQTNPNESEQIIASYAPKVWKGLKPQLRHLLLTQGFDPVTYNPLDWSYADPDSGKVATIREMIVRIRTRLDQIEDPSSREYVGEFLKLVDQADTRLKEYLSGASVGPTAAEAAEPRTSTALAVMAATNAIVASGGAVVKVELPLSRREFTPHAAETVFGKFTAKPDYEVFTRDVWTELLYRKDGSFNESEWNRLRILARGLLKDIGVNVEGEFKETDQEVMYQTTRSMLDPFDADPPPVRKRKEKYAAALDMAWSVWMSDLASEKGSPPAH